MLLVQAKHLRVFNIFNIGYGFCYHDASLDTSTNKKHFERKRFNEQNLIDTLSLSDLEITARRQQMANLPANRVTWNPPFAAFGTDLI